MRLIVVVGKQKLASSPFSIFQRRSYMEFVVCRAQSKEHALKNFVVIETTLERCSQLLGGIGRHRISSFPIPMIDQDKSLATETFVKITSKSKNENSDTCPSLVLRAL
jgi:hypothetical protein